MTFSDFLENDPYEQTGGFETIALVTIETVWAAGFGKGRDAAHFPFTPDSKGENQRESREICLRYIQENDVRTQAGKVAKPNLGILTTIPIETHLTASDNFNYDVKQFIASSECAKLQLAKGGWMLNEKQKEEFRGRMPYDVILEALQQIPAFEIGVPVWGSLEEVVNDLEEARGYRSNKDYPEKYYVLREIFLDKAAAYAAAGKEMAGDPLQPLTAENWTLQGLTENEGTIAAEIQKAMKGENPKKVVMSIAEATNFVCSAFQIDPVDLKYIGLELEPKKAELKEEEIPF